MAQYNLSFNPVWDFVNLTGQQVDDTYYFFTLSNLFPYDFSPIYMDQIGTPWSDPIQLLANGTLPTNLYWDDTLVYRLQLRHGPDQSYPLIYEIDNYIPVSGSIGPSPTPGNNSGDNLITNPQFSDVQFQLPMSIATAGTTQIAPGWQIVTAGTGTVTISQGNQSGLAAIPTTTNASYYISITNFGFNSVTLQQTFSRNGSLWTGEAVSLSMTGYSTSATQVQGYLTYSGSSRTLNIIAPNLGPQWSTTTNSIAIDPSTNTNVGTNAFTTLNLFWEGNTTVYLTSIQLLGQDAVDDTVTYAQVPIERQIDHEFHYYLPQLSYKPIPSYLVGWDFPLNPCQELGPTAVTSAAINYYVADQTILYQTVPSAFTMTQDNQGFNFTCGIASTFALVQYLSGNTPVEILQQRMSALVQGFVNSGTLNVTVNLVWTANASINVIPLSVVNSVLAGPVTTYAMGWQAIPRILGAAQCTFSTTSSINAFTGFDATLVAGIKTAKFFAFVISFDAATPTQVITVSRASLNGGDIATLPAPQTFDEVLRECQFYYEKSYNNDDLPGMVSGTGYPSFGMPVVSVPTGPTSPSTNAGYGAFDVQFNTIKRSASPTITFYNPSSGTSNNVNMIFYYNGALLAQPSESFSSNWTLSSRGSKFASWISTSTSTFGTTAAVYAISYAYMNAHYTIDARLGVVV